MMACLNNERHQFSDKFSKSLAYCNKVSRGTALHSQSLLNNDRVESLILQLFELGKLFIEKKMVTFTAQGACMYPCIRQGDIIYIQPKSAEDIEIEEVAVYRRNNHLFSHRTIAKGRNEKGHYIITRPDTAKYKDDGPSYNENILGVVTRIERKNRVFTPVKKDYNLLERIGVLFCLNYFCIRQYFLHKVIYLIIFLQQFKLYRLIARLFSKNLYKKINYMFSIPLHNKATDKFFKKVTESELVDLVSNNQNHSILRWKIALKVNSKQVASLSFILRPYNYKLDRCWLVEAQIGIRYRGTVIDEVLLAKTDELLRLMGVSVVFTRTCLKAYSEQMFFKGLGFKRIYACDDEALKNSVKPQATKEWLIMQRIVKS
jgi:hypothetical protein